MSTMFDSLKWENENYSSTDDVKEEDVNESGSFDNKDITNSYDNDIFVRDVLTNTSDLQEERAESLLSDDNKTLLQNNRAPKCTPKWYWVTSLLGNKESSAFCHPHPEPVSNNLTSCCRLEPTDLSGDVDTSHETMSSGDTGTSLLYDSQAHEYECGV